MRSSSSDQKRKKRFDNVVAVVWDKMSSASNEDKTLLFTSGRNENVKNRIFKESISEKEGRIKKGVIE